MNFLKRAKMSLIVDSRRELRRVILALLPKTPGKSLLDLGCDDCKITRILANAMKADTVFGVDLIDGYKEGIDIRGSDLNVSIPFPDASFNVVTASQIIEHLSNPWQFVGEIYRVLQPEGCAIIGTNNLASWHNIVYLLLGFQPETAVVSEELYPDRSPAPKHLIIFTLRELVKLLRARGFQIEQVKCCGYPPFTGRLARLACTLDKRHSSLMYVKAKKKC